MLRIREVALTDGQLKSLEIVERTASALSALGVITIITVFCLAPQFRNPMHRLIFINAFYNAFDVTCTMISISGPAAGNSSALCQFQGFLNQMFPLADVLWTLAMAVDVFLIVFRRYDTESLKRLEWKYAAIITPVTFVPAFVFLFVHTEAKGPLYGSVTLWCAIAPKWVLLRIVLYYVPIWTMILIIILIYFMVGIEIVKRRRALRDINSDFVPLDDTVVSTADTPYENSNYEVDVQSHSGHIFTLHSGDESLLTTSKHSITAPRRGAATHHLNASPHSSLSFRQYILMPLFFFLALLSVWVAPSTNRVGTFVNPSFSSYPILLAVGATGSLRGFWNGLVFITIGMKSRQRRKELGRTALPNR